MKTNLEELNYRFIKELLNDKAYKKFSIMNAAIYAELNDKEFDFNYDAWCKGLFKSTKKIIGFNHSEKESLKFYLEQFYYEEGITFDDFIWDEYYKKGSPIDLINIKELKDKVIDLWWQQDESEIEHQQRLYDLKINK